MKCRIGYGSKLKTTKLTFTRRNTCILFHIWILLHTFCHFCPCLLSDTDLCFTHSVSSSLGTGDFFPLLSSTGSGDSSPNNSPNCPTTIKQLAENGEGTEKHWTSRTDLSFSKWKYKHGDHFKDRWWEPYWVVSYKIRTEFKKRLSQMSKTVSKK